ncbi:MAG: NAD(P)/FAD-dependent oxidoreductase [Candidatus Nanopelagicales bacterium]|nr:NAD(P)/FAD-dependent oxidoreductase [Candidatus Nanopelagicales bacterium]
MPQTTADVIVIGLGPGGEDVAGNLAEAGLDVVGIEKELVGGECPYWGCVPSKMMIRAAGALQEGRRIPQLAGTSDVHPDYRPVARRIRDEATDDWNDQVAVDRFTGKGGRFVRGTGRLVSRDRVVVGDQTYNATRAVVIAAGSRAAIPPVPGLESTPFWTNRDAVKAEQPPSSLIVMGGGAIGVELAQVFSRFGSTVTIVEGADRILPPEEPESSQILSEVLSAEGIDIHTGRFVDAVAYTDGMFEVTVGGVTMTAEKVLVATGRTPNSDLVGAEVLGVDLPGGYLPVDDHMQVVPGVFAVGDIAGKGAFTHMAMYEAAICERAILGRPGAGADYSAVSHVTFTDPEVGSVGLTEQQARAAGITVAVGTVSVPSTSRGWIHKVGNEGIIKVVADAERGVLVGATSVGPTGGEVLSFLALAVRAQVPIATLKNMIYAYPTIWRGIETAIHDTGL